MPRRSRIVFENAFFHIFNRGLNKQAIFQDESDYKKFLILLEALKTKKQFDHSIYAYVLMPNHFHFLIQVRKTPLKKIMSSLLTSYSMYFNRKYKRVGILFQNRYKSKLCQKESYFLGASRYIILNPVEAKIVKDPKDYLWSSYQEVFGNTRSNVIDRSEIVKLIGDDEKQKENYKQFLMAGIKIIDQLNKEYDDFHKDIIGSPSFNSLSQKKYLRRKYKTI